MTFSAVVLAGGTAARLGGADKPALEVGGRSLLSRALDAVAGAGEVVVVGEAVATQREVRFTREEPAYGGPVAALLAGRDALVAPGERVVVLACDMPYVDPSTVERLVAAADGHDGAALVGPDGRRQLALVLDVGRLDGVRPARGEEHGMPLHRLLAPLSLAEVAAAGREHRDVDTWQDVEELS